MNLSDLGTALPAYAIQGQPQPSIDYKAQMTTANLDAPQLEFLKSSFACTNSDVTYIAGDGSTRQYYRITKAFESYPSLVVMKLAGEDKDQLRAGTYPFLATSAVLAHHGVRVPAIVAQSPELGLIVLEDFGDTTLFDHLGSTAASGPAPSRPTGMRSVTLSAKSDAYKSCFKVLTSFLTLKGTTEDRWQQWAFDEAKLAFEFDFFIKHYVQAAHRKGHDKEGQGVGEELATERDRLCSLLAADSHYFSHRDFHSKNIMVLPGSDGPMDLGIIDFQDARLGPASYDAVSLFFDPYAPLDLEERHQLYEAYCTKAETSCPPAAVKTLRSLKEPMILQRLTKALGSFGYLTLDQKRGDYLQHQGPALDILLSLPSLHSDYPHIMGILAAIHASEPIHPSA